MQIVALKDLAVMLEKTIQEVLEESKEAGALMLVPGRPDIEVDLEVYQKYMEDLIIDIGKKIYV
jgi:prefoldin subunit 5